MAMYQGDTTAKMMAAKIAHRRQPAEHVDWFNKR